MKKRGLYAGVAAVAVALFLAGAPAPVGAQPADPAIVIGATDLGGIVSGPNGREAGVYRLARLGACCSLLFLVGWAVVAMNLLSHFYLFNEGLDPWFRVLQALGTLGIAGTIPVLWSLCLTWTHRRWWASRVWSIALAVSSLAIVWFAVVFHLITIDLSY